MKIFLFKIFIFAFLILTALSAAFFYFYKIGGSDLTAPNFSNSISFNEKIDFIRDKELSKVEHIVIGSSMALNNIDSETMVKYLGENYLNLASWGFKISDSEKYLENMHDLFPALKTVIISTGFMDFSENVRNIQVDYTLARNSILFRLGLLPYIISPDLKYFYNNSKSNSVRRSVRNSYQNLVYDKYGGAILDIDSDKINQERWNKNILEFDVSDKELKSLHNLILFLKNRNVRTVVSIAPQRDGLYDSLKSEEINSNVSKIEKIVEKSGGIFVNSFKAAGWNDSLFVDYCHLNKAGAEIYTDNIAIATVNSIKAK